MMKAFFEPPAAQERLYHHALPWLGTPFAARAAVMGAGVDCVHLVAAIYRACGFLKEFKPPDYSLDGGKHNAQSQLVTWLEAAGRFEKIHSATLGSAVQPGDTLCFKFPNQSEHHAGLKLLGPFFVHVLERRRVEIATLLDRTFSRTLAAVYRPLL